MYLKVCCEYKEYKISGKPKVSTNMEIEEIEQKRKLDCGECSLNGESASSPTSSRSRSPRRRLLTTRSIINLLELVSAEGMPNRETVGVWRAQNKMGEGGRVGDRGMTHNTQGKRSYKQTTLGGERGSASYRGGGEFGQDMHFYVSDNYLADLHAYYYGDLGGAQLQ